MNVWMRLLIWLIVLVITFAMAFKVIEISDFRNNEVTMEEKIENDEQDE